MLLTADKVQPAMQTLSVHAKLLAHCDFQDNAQCLGKLCNAQSLGKCQPYMPLPMCACLPGWSA